MGKKVVNDNIQNDINKDVICSNEINEFEKVSIRVSGVSVFINIVLSVFKLIAGIVANSAAMVSDAVHSASDVFSSIVVMIGARISAKESDKDHPYGHERLECVAAIILATILCGTGLGIGYRALMQVFNGDYGSLEEPGILAIIAAIISIVVKEAMYWYTRANALKIDSSALMADAWHHRSDSLSSIGALVGITGARMGIKVLDPVASIVICVFIAKAAHDIFVDAINKMVDKACEEETEKRMEECALSVSGVERVDVLHTRVFGNKIYVDMEIAADGDKPLKETHAIAEMVHDEIERTFPKVKHIMIHVNPM